MSAGSFQDINVFINRNKSRRAENVNNKKLFIRLIDLNKNVMNTKGTNKISDDNFLFFLAFWH